MQDCLDKVREYAKFSVCSELPNPVDCFSTGMYLNDDYAGRKIYDHMHMVGGCTLRYHPWRTGRPKVLWEFISTDIIRHSVYVIFI